MGENLQFVVPSRLVILLKGSWNPRIFTPPWVQTFLFESDQKLNVMFNILSAELGFEYKGISLFPKHSQIKISCDNYETASVIYAKEIADKILTTLQHTPVNSADIELTFELSYENSERKVLEQFQNIKVSEFELSAFKFTKAESKGLNKEMLVSTVGEKLQVVIINRFNRNSFLENSIADVVEQNSKEVSIWQLK